MSIDDAIASNGFFAACVLPSEFDAERKCIWFQLTEENGYRSTEGIRLNLSPFAPYTKKNSQPATSQQNHEAVVNAALAAIENSVVEKVVVSCIKHAPCNTTNLATYFHRLCDRYAHAFVYILNHPEHGIWMGATPELLLHKQGSQFRTVSLAGTQPFQETESIVWSDKLKHEQELVTEFITDTLSNIQASDIQFNGPYSAQAGPLAHLKTDIRFQSQVSSSVIIDALQPTPAVCGLPREAALSFIQQHADFDRRLYAGRIGLHYPSGDEIHFVNLRCMQVFEDHFELHVGGGIVAGSIAADEWRETEIKADVLRAIIQ
jgi:isochorismate synthase